MSFLGGGDAESDESLHQLIVNEHYAKAFQYKKEREELNKCKIISLNFSGGSVAPTEICHF